MCLRKLYWWWSVLLWNASLLKENILPWISILRLRWRGPKWRPWFCGSICRSHHIDLNDFLHKKNKSSTNVIFVPYQEWVCCIRDVNTLGCSLRLWTQLGFYRFSFSLHFGVSVLYWTWLLSWVSFWFDVSVVYTWMLICRWLTTRGWTWPPTLASWHCSLSRLTLQLNYARCPKPRSYMWWLTKARRLKPGSTCWIAIPCGSWVFLSLGWQLTV